MTTPCKTGIELCIQGLLPGSVWLQEGQGWLLVVVCWKPLLFVYSLDYARTRLANDAKSSKKGGGERQFNGLLDVYRKTLATDGIAGLYRGFVISCAGIIVYRGLYFGIYDSLKPVVLVGSLEVFLWYFILDDLL
jgi:hypothetical protein